MVHVSLRVLVGDIMERKDGFPITNVGNEGGGGMTVNEQFCRIALFLPNFVQGVVYAYALYPGCGATLIRFRLG